MSRTYVVRTTILFKEKFHAKKKSHEIAALVLRSANKSIYHKTEGRRGLDPPLTSLAGGGGKRRRRRRRRRGISQGFSVLFCHLGSYEK